MAILAKDVMRGDKYSIAGDTLTMGQGSHRVFLPVTGKHDGPNMDWSGRFVIQNMSDTVQACVQITYLSIQTDSEVAWEPYKLPTSGKPSDPQPGCPNGGMPLPARGSIFKYPDNMAVSDKFTGSVRIDLLTVKPTTVLRVLHGVESRLRHVKTSYVVIRVPGNSDPAVFWAYATSPSGRSVYAAATASGKVTYRSSS